MTEMSFLPSARSTSPHERNPQGKIAPIFRNPRRSKFSIGHSLVVKHELFRIEDRPEQVLEHGPRLLRLEVGLNPLPLRLARIPRERTQKDTVQLLRVIERGV